MEKKEDGRKDEENEMLTILKKIKEEMTDLRKEVGKDEERMEDKRKV